ncbi:MAG: hypothetical protein ACTS6J_02360 [Burkholderiales bacterium]
MIVIKREIGLAGLIAKLVRAHVDDARASAFTTSLKALNPHVDFTQLAAGTVLLVPDAVELKPGASTSLGSATFEAFVKELDTGLGSASALIKQGVERFSGDRTSVSAVLKTAAMKRLVKSDPVLSKQIEAVAAQFKDDETKMLAAQKLMETVQKQVNEELAGLAGLFD